MRVCSLLFFASFALLSASGCDGPLAGPRPGAPAWLEIVSGNLQEGEVATSLPEPLVVRVLSRDGQPVAGVEVVWSASAGHLTRGEATTDRYGRSAASWTLTSQAGEHAVDVSVQKLDPVRLTAKALPGAPVELTILGGGAPLTVGDTTQFRAVTPDRHGNELVPTDVEWRSSDTTIATVVGGPEGRADVIARAVGSTGISARAGDLQMTVTTQAFQPIAPRRTSLAATDGTTCALNASGQAMCWGDNRLGAVGDGTLTGRAVPTLVEGGRVFVEVASGSGHTCGLVDDGSVYCWGDAGRDENAVRQHSATPMRVAGAHEFVDIDGGGHKACGVTRAGDIYCWDPVALQPTRVVSDVRFAAVAVGTGHACGLSRSGHAFCWGDNWAGELGNGIANNGSTNSPQSSPVAVTWDVRFVELALGHAISCGIAIDGKGYCWGSAYYGALGTGGFENSGVPIAIALDKPLQAIHPGHWSTCAVAADGSGWCWGVDGGTPREGVSFTAPYLAIGDAASEVCPAGDPYFPCTRSPAPVEGDVSMAEIVLGRQHACASSSDGQVYCWGPMGHGQIGQDRFAYAIEPQRVIDSGVAKLSLGSSRSCALMDDGILTCWGGGRPDPTVLFPDRRFTTADVGFFVDICAIETSGRAVCWDEDWDGHGSPNSREPVAIDGGLAFDSVTAGYNHVCGLTADGTVHCRYRAGGSEGVWASELLEVPGGHSFVSISAGLAHTCGITADGFLYCWGSVKLDQWGMLEESETPIRFGEGLKFRSLSTAPQARGVCGVTTEDEAYCLIFGRDPRPIAPGTAVRSMASHFHGCIVDMSGTVWCWGNNTWGQTGQPLRWVNNEDVARVDAAATFDHVAVGTWHTCALADGAVYCWGADTVGQVGDGDPLAVRSPTPVVKR